MKIHYKPKNWLGTGGICGKLASNEYLTGVWRKVTCKECLKSKKTKK